MKTVIASGYFDPIHIGHIEYLNKAAELGNRLIVIVNNDNQCKLKKDKPFQPEWDRLTIVRNLKSVYRAFLAIDQDRSVCKSIRDIHASFSDVMIFAKGGDRTADEIPEAAICKELGIEIVDGLGEKIRSSSDLIVQADQIVVDPKNAGNEQLQYIVKSLQANYKLNDGSIDDDFEKLFSISEADAKAIWNMKLQDIHKWFSERFKDKS